MYATFGPNGMQGTPAPLNLFFAEKLHDLGIIVLGAVTVILFDKQGNSIWGQGIGPITITPISATRVTFSVDALEIIGGTGKLLMLLAALLALVILILRIPMR
jgi:hypothetical protein